MPTATSPSPSSPRAEGNEDLQRLWTSAGRAAGQGRAALGSFTEDTVYTYLV